MIKGKNLSLKDNIEAVKKELSAEEQFLESIVKAEGFWKKYKKLVITAIVLLIAGILAYTLYTSIKEKNLQASNEAFLTLQKDSKNAEALDTLKSKNPKLYELFVFQDGIKSADASKLKALSSQVSDPLLKDLVSYQEASLSGKGLDAYSLKQGALLKDLASLEEVYTLFNAGKSKEAKALLSKIPPTSQLQQIVQSFKHYMK